MFQGGKHLPSLKTGPVKILFTSMKINNSLNVPAPIKSLPDSPGQYTDTWSCAVPLRGIPCVSAPFVNGQLVLDLGNTYATKSN